MYQATAKRPKLDGQQRQRELRLPLPAGDQCRRCGGETEIMHGSGKVRCHHCDEVVPYTVAASTPGWMPQPPIAVAAQMAAGSMILLPSSVQAVLAQALPSAVVPSIMAQLLLSAVCPMIVVVVPMMLGRSRSTSQEDAQ